MTPGINALKKHKVDFEILHYEHDSNMQSFGLEVCEKLKLPANKVFKTLMVELSNNTLVSVLVPVSSQLNMKILAQHMHVKSAKMASPSQVKNSSGYVLGGVSPFGQKKLKHTIVDISAQDLDDVYVSAGKRGLEIKIRPEVLHTLLKASFVSIAH